MMHMKTKLSAAVAAIAICSAALAAPPSVDEVLDRAAKAMGGKDAISKMKSVHTKLQMNVQQMALDMEWGWTDFGGRFAKTKMPMQAMELWSDGKVAWMKTGSDAEPSYMLLPESQLDQLEGQAAFFISVLDTRRYAKQMKATLTPAEPAEFNGRQCNCVLFADKEGESGHLFFDIETGLPAGGKMTEEAMGQQMTTTFVFTDWKKMEGTDIKLCREMRMEGGGLPEATTMKITKAAVDTLSKDDFKLPEKVKELVANQGEASGSDGEIALEDLPEMQRPQATEMVNRMKGMPKEQLAQALQGLEMSLGMVPADQKMMLEYVLQELKKLM